MSSHSKILIASALLFAASVGFFASAFVFNHSPGKMFCSKNTPAEIQKPFKHSMKKSDFPKKEMKERHEKMEKYIGLTEEQKQALKEQKKKKMNARMESKKERQQVEHRLREVLSADSLDEAALKSVKDSLMALNAKELDAKIADVRFWINTLTPEQSAKMRQFHEKKGKHKSGGKKH
ncbi:MAG: Spy/CpxP family protein refolding chaperone [Fibrobacter sp.]|jgi:Spy/CpxP family protein refolding chaperone|nr:Spy/CpxP family protein refolding chaperone [Fibrobacter sp.]